MLYCPKCHKLFHDDGVFCPFDGTKLILPPSPLLGTQVGSYFILDILGKGGMGTVYKAEHVFIGKQVAVKVLHPRFKEHKDFVDRFLFEARSAAKINHPNIVDITDFGYTETGLPFFVMEYMEGKELLDLILDEAPLPVYRVVNILSQTADALAASHEAGIVHQDLKPENIFLVKKRGNRQLVRIEGKSGSPYSLQKEDSFDMVKILDFGVAHLATLTEGDTVTGTPEYMAPEQIKGIKGDPRSDIFSIGVIFYEMLTGDLPFTGDTPEEVFRKILTEDTPSIKKSFPRLKFSRQIEKVVFKSLAKDPKYRFQTMEEFLSELRLCFGDVFYSRDIPVILNKRHNSSIDSKLEKDLKSLFSSSGKTGAAKRKKSLPGKKPAKKPEDLNRIDPSLARDLQSLFKKK